ncbi:hypothetical protein BJV82DRAFT_373356 [Fennellomyces sp. T-0311]|nr:hypothetical protein BJV82DRAFT_373356 [Fennellomyces sp. T-0311]
MLTCLLLILLKTPLPDCAFSLTLYIPHSTILTMSTPSNIPRQPTAIPWRIPDRDLCEWNAFAHIASHGTEEEKEAVGLPRDFKLACGVDAELSRLFRSAGEEQKAALAKKCKEMMEESKMPPQNLEDKKTGEKAYETSEGPYV